MRERERLVKGEELCYVEEESLAEGGRWYGRDRTEHDQDAWAEQERCYGPDRSKHEKVRLKSHSSLDE